MNKFALLILITAFGCSSEPKASKAPGLELTNELLEQCETLPAPLAIYDLLSPLMAEDLKMTLGSLPEMQRYVRVELSMEESKVSSAKASRCGQYSMPSVLGVEIEKALVGTSPNYPFLEGATDGAFSFVVDGHGFN